jgi:hypothetical protein
MMLSALAILLAATASSIPLDLAAQYFREAQVVSGRDGGDLWGRPLYGPMLLVDPETRAVAANQADGLGLLKPEGGVWTGKLPEEQNIANTAVKWAGVKWTMLMWPLPEQKPARLKLVMHELFHRIQDQLELPMAEASSRHLATKEGRIWLQLEWRALEEALGEQGQGRGKAIEDALIFRAWRRELSPAAAAEESRLELNEELAEYTGVRLSANSRGQSAVAAGCELRQGSQRPSFERSFAYVSGPAYGLLLDDSKLKWREQLKGGADLGELLAQAYGLKLPGASREEALRRAGSYDGADLMALETRREEARQARLAKYRSELIAHSVVVLPLSSRVSYSFNPNNVMALDETATVFPTIRVVDDWGILEASAGALLLREGGRAARVQVPAPADPSVLPLKGPGWTLTLNDGWTIAPGGRSGDLTVKKAQ